MSPLVIAIILFAIAAVFGGTMAVLRFSNKPISLGMALGHGAFAALGLVTLIVAVAKGASGLAVGALVLFLAAAAGGFYLFSKYLRKIELPIPLVVIHGLAAVTGFLMLLIAVATLG